MVRSTSEVLDNAIRVLLYSGQKENPKKWQSVKNPARIIELDNLFLTMSMSPYPDQIHAETKADIPWAEDHFQERISGKATNPGKEYKNWPYYKHSEDNDRFRGKGEFSHTYQERFWPPKRHGIRFNMGDYQEVKDRLKEDLSTRQAFLSIWHPEDQSLRPERRVPCTIGYWFKVKDGRLNLTYLIRSCDALRHFRNDVYMAQRLAGDMAEYVGVELGILTMWIGSFHCFESDTYTLKKKLS